MSQVCQVAFVNHTQPSTVASITLPYRGQWLQSQTGAWYHCLTQGLSHTGKERKPLRPARCEHPQRPQERTSTMTSTSLFMPQTIEAIKNLSPNVVGEVSADLLACAEEVNGTYGEYSCLLYTSPSPRDRG